MKYEPPSLALKSSASMIESKANESKGEILIHDLNTLSSREASEET